MIITARDAQAAINDRLRGHLSKCFLCGGFVEDTGDFPVYFPDDEERKTLGWQEGTIFVYNICDACREAYGSGFYCMVEEKLGAHKEEFHE